MPDADVRDELEDLHTHVQTVIPLRSRRQQQDSGNDHPLTLHFIVPVVRDPHVVKVRSLTELCGLRVKVETYKAPKGPLHANAVGALSTRSVAAATHLDAWHNGTPTYQQNVPPQSSSLNVVAARETTLQAMVVEVSGKSKGSCRKAQGVRGQKDGVFTHLAAPKVVPPGLSPEQTLYGLEPHDPMRPRDQV
jgi:hypothetical protein